MNGRMATNDANSEDRLPLGMDAGGATAVCVHEDLEAGFASVHVTLECTDTSYVVVVAIPHPSPGPAKHLFSEGGDRVSVKATACPIVRVSNLVLE